MKKFEKVTLGIDIIFLSMLVALIFFVVKDSDIGSWFGSLFFLVGLFCLIFNIILSGNKIYLDIRLDKNKTIFRIFRQVLGSFFFLSILNYISYKEVNIKWNIIMSLILGIFFYRPSKEMTFK